MQLSLLSLAAVLLLSHLPHAHGSPLLFLSARSPLNDHDDNFTALFESAKKRYSPLAGCEAACQPFVADLKTCEDDSCICTQSGLDHFSECVRMS